VNFNVKGKSKHHKPICSEMLYEFIH